MSMDTMNETGSRFIMTGADIVRMGESAEMLVGGKNYNTALISRVEGIRTPQFRAIPATAFHVVLDESRVNASLVYDVVDTAMAEVDWASPAVASDHGFFGNFVRRAAAEIRERGAGKSASTCLRDFINQVVHGFAESQENIDQLREKMQQRTTMFSGHSGSGKSSLVNAVESTLNLKTAEISTVHHQGQHTTTFAQMFPLSFGGYVVDTPGIRGFGLVDMDPHEVGDYFPEIFALKGDCRFHDCLHTDEPDCAVVRAVEQGRIAPSRYMSYLGILSEDDGPYREDPYK